MIVKVYLILMFLKGNIIIFIIELFLILFYFFIVGCFGIWDYCSNNFNMFGCFEWENM